MTTPKASDFQERLDSLPPIGKQRTLEYLRFWEEKEQPWHAQEIDALEQEYISKFEKIVDLRETLGWISADIKNAISSTLSKNEKALLAEFEILTFAIFLTQYKPFCLFKKRGMEFKLAKESAARSLVLLTKLKKAEKRAEGGHYDKP